MSLVYTMLHPDQHPAWDAFVERTPGGSLFHTSRWLSRVGQGLAVHTLHDDDGEIQAGLALVETTKYHVRGFHVPPYTPRYGPVVRPSRKKQAGSIATEMQEMVSTLLDHLPDSPHVDLLLNAGHQDIIPYHFRGWQCTVKLTHQLCCSIEDYKANMVKTKAYYLRKLGKRIESGELAIVVDHDIDSVLELWSETAGLKNFRTNDKVLNQLFCDPAEGFWTCLRVHDEKGTTLGAMCLVHDDNTAYNILNAVRRDLQGDLKRTNVLLMDAGIRHALERKLCFDFEGSMLPGVEDFYRTFGGRQLPTYRVMRTRSLLFHGLRFLSTLRRERRGGKSA